MLDPPARGFEACRRLGLTGRVVVGVSGGGDSVALLRALGHWSESLGWSLVVAHLHHGTRGAEADGDASFVAELAEAMGLPFELGHWAPTRSGHFESDARRARLAWLAQIAQSHRAVAVMLGHTRDDQIETILHRIARGTGLAGLAGIPARRPLVAGIDLIRPFLDVTRAELREWLHRIGQPWREDRTNADVRRSRSLLRHEVIPLLERVHPGASASIARLGAIARAADRSWSRRRARLGRRLTSAKGPGSIALDRGSWEKLDEFERAEVLRWAWRQLGAPERAMGHARWLRLARPGSGRRHAGGGFEVIATDDEILVRSIPKAEGVSPSPPRVAVAGPGESPWAGGAVALVESASGDDVLDADTLDFPLTLRGPRPGDRFAPLRLKGGSQALADAFRSRGVPRDERPGHPVLCDDRGIVWVGGLGIADRVKITESTRRFLAVTWRRPG